MNALYSFNCFGPADIVIATTIADIAFDTNVLVLFYITTKASCIGISSFPKHKQSSLIQVYK